VRGCSNTLALTPTHFFFFTHTSARSLRSLTLSGYIVILGDVLTPYFYTWIADDPRTVFSQSVSSAVIERES
jgi:hypothetical protein